MPIEFNCPSCGKAIRTPDGSAGKRGKCPNCESIMQIPEASSDSPPSAIQTGVPGKFAPGPIAGQPSPSVQNDLFGNPGENAFGGATNSQSTPSPGSVPANTGLGSGMPSSTNPYSDQANPYQTPSNGETSFLLSPTDAKQQVMLPAIAILATDGLAALLLLGYGIVNAVLAPTIEFPPAANQAEEIGQNIGFVFAVSLPFLFAIPSVVAVCGAYCMLRLKSFGIAVTGVIASLVSICSCSFPLGIWALVVLLSADVKQAFR